MVKRIEPRQEEYFGRLLTIAMVEPSLQSLLVLDGTERDLVAAAQSWKGMLAIAHSASVNTLTLDSSTTEEKLWGRFAIESGQHGGETQIQWLPSKLVDHGDRPLLVVIPDLTRLSLVAMRACVMLLGNEVASIQRDGVDRTWQPRFWCIARCPGDRLGEVSPHLLDRFSLRCRTPGFQVEALSPLERFKKFELAAQSKLEDIQLSTQLEKFAQQAQGAIANAIFPAMSEQAIARVQSYFTKKVPIGMRRLIVLTKMARGLARLEQETGVYWETVDDAAKLLGLRQELLSLEPSRPKVEPELPSSATEIIDPPTDPVEPVISPSQPEMITQEVVKPDRQESLPPTTVELEPEEEETDDLFLEDEAPVMRELEPLKIPISSRRSPRTSFGYPIGTEPATTLEDISMLGTVFEAIKFQNYRRRAATTQGQEYSFRIWLSDLRSYRRMPVPQYHLICAIDFTCLENREWEDALVPHLRDWAYVNRASISIIRIGAKDAKEPLRSHLVQARNLLASEVFDAFDGDSGVASPLAHGLDLAAKTARTALQHGRNHVMQARLVVLTDGRGNIPLQVSLENHFDEDEPVSQEGIEDALAAAKVLAEIPRLEIVLLDPQPTFYKELPKTLAKSLGAIVEEIEVKPPSLSKEAMDLEVLEPLELEPISLMGDW